MKLYKTKLNVKFYFNKEQQKPFYKLIISNTVFILCIFKSIYIFLSFQQKCLQNVVTRVDYNNNNELKVKKKKKFEKSINQKLAF